jgi:uncharacterized protein YabN with tetrapyrrole methylase and pyrophosphatase domain
MGGLFDVCTTWRMTSKGTTAHTRLPSGGSLLIVGSGVGANGQMTAGAARAIAGAERVLFAVDDALTVRAIRALNPSSMSLDYPRDRSLRREAYRAMVECVLSPLRDGLRVCAVFYGHPGVFASPGRALLRHARARGFGARMLPGVSFLDCQFADLELDPGQRGCQIHEAGAFLLRRLSFDPRVPLVLCQIALIGNDGFYDPRTVVDGLGRLRARLMEVLPAAHGVVLYEAALAPTVQYRADRLPLSDLPLARVSEISTLYVPEQERPGAGVGRELSIASKD